MRGLLLSSLPPPSAGPGKACIAAWPQPRNGWAERQDPARKQEPLMLSCGVLRHPQPIVLRKGIISTRSS